MRLYRDIVPSSSLGIVPDLHQLTRRRIDEALAGFLPRATGCNGRAVAPPLEEDGREHDRAVHEEVEYLTLHLDDSMPGDFFRCDDDHLYPPLAMVIAIPGPRRCAPPRYDC